MPVTPYLGKYPPVMVEGLELDIGCKDERDEESAYDPEDQYAFSEPLIILLDQCSEIVNSGRYAANTDIGDFCPPHRYVHVGSAIHARESIKPHAYTGRLYEVCHTHP